jgi:putative addiction module killer protein
LKVRYGPGYRVYFMQRGMVAVLLCGGDKSSQRRDIALAKAIAAQLKGG